MNSVSNRRYSLAFLVVVVFFVTCLIASNIIAVKLVDIGGLILPAAVIVFPISYIFGDIITEVYGYSQMRRVIWLGFASNLLIVLIFWLAQSLPSASFWDGQASYERILGFTPRLLLASFVAYLIGEFANAFILAKLKIATKGQWLWLRTISSTFVGQGLDSVVFITIAFVGTIATGDMVNTIITQWLFKVGYEVIATPLTYFIVNYLKRYEGIDTFDTDTRFNPLLVTE